MVDCLAAFAGSISRCSAERLCTGGRLGPVMHGSHAASAIAHPGPGQSQPGRSNGHPGEHACLQQRMLVPWYVYIMSAALVSFACTSDTQACPM